MAKAIRPPSLFPATVAALLLATPLRGGALDRFEIQVYQAEINSPGQLGVELHLNYTADGVRSRAYPGEIPPYGAFRMTLEPAVGVTPWLEFGAYLQYLLAPGGVAQFGGAKARAKLVLPEEQRQRLGIPVFLGLNVEVGKVPAAIEQQGWANEFRPIVGWKNARWLLAVNPIFGYALTGPDAFRVDLEPAAKVAFDTRLGFALGVEYYAGLGLVGDGFLPVKEQEHLLLGVFDLVPPAGAAPAGSPSRAEWEVNLAVGGGLTSATGQHLVVKTILGRSL